MIPIMTIKMFLVKSWDEKIGKLTFSANFGGEKKHFPTSGGQRGVCHDVQGRMVNKKQVRYFVAL